MALTDSLTNYWTLNETSGNRVDSYGSVTLSPTGTVSTARGVYSNAAVFASDGSLLGDSTPASLTSAAYSVSLWWKFGTANTGTDVILSAYTSVPGDGILIYTVDIPGGDTAYLRASHALGGTGVTLSDVITKGTGWHHIVQTYSDSGNLLCLYHNGVLFDSDTITEGASTTTTPLSIARDSNVNGTCDEVGIWSRALSAAEVLWLYGTRTLDPDYEAVPGLKIEKLVQEDFNVGTDTVWVQAPGGGKLLSTRVGMHSFARGQVEYESAWTPGAITAGSKVSTTATVPNAAVADYVLASHDKVLTSDLRVSAHVSAANTVKVVIHNPTSSSVTVAAGTLRVLVFSAYTP